MKLLQHSGIVRLDCASVSYPAPIRRASLSGFFRGEGLEVLHAHRASISKVTSPAGAPRGRQRDLPGPAWPAATRSTFWAGPRRRGGRAGSAAFGANPGLGDLEDCARPGRRRRAGPRGRPELVLLERLLDLRLGHAQRRILGVRLCMTWRTRRRRWARPRRSGSGRSVSPGYPRRPRAPGAGGGLLREAVLQLLDLLLEVLGVPEDVPRPGSAARAGSRAGRRPRAGPASPP